VNKRSAAARPVPPSGTRRGNSIRRDAEPFTARSPCVDLDRGASAVGGEDHLDAGVPEGAAVGADGAAVYGDDLGHDGEPPGVGS